MVLWASCMYIIDGFSALKMFYYINTYISEAEYWKCICVVDFLVFFAKHIIVGHLYRNIHPSITIYFRSLFHSSFHHYSYLLLYCSDVAVAEPAQHWPAPKSDRAGAEECGQLVRVWLPPGPHGAYIWAGLPHPSPEGWVRHAPQRDVRCRCRHHCQSCHSSWHSQVWFEREKNLFRFVCLVICMMKIVTDFWIRLRWCFVFLFLCVFLGYTGVLFIVTLDVGYLFCLLRKMWMCWGRHTSCVDFACFCICSENCPELIWLHWLSIWIVTVMHTPVCVFQVPQHIAEAVCPCPEAAGVVRQGAPCKGHGELCLQHVQKAEASSVG